MTKLPSLIPTAALAALACLSAVPARAVVDYENADFVYFKAAKGDYAGAKNWETGAVPQGKVNACFKTPGGVATLSSPVPAVRGVMVGSTGAGTTLYICDKAKLEFSYYLRAYSNIANTRAFIDMSGGSVSSDQGLLRVGTSATFSAQGVMTISGGVMRCGLCVGAPAAAKGSGRLVVRGQGPDIADGKHAPMSMVDETGTLEFILDAAGVAPLNYAKRTFRFAKGARLCVDASAYRGSAQCIPLILAWKWEGADTLETSVTAQPKDATAAVVVGQLDGKAAIYLDIQKKK